MAQQKVPSTFILLLLVSFASVSAVLFTPGLPQIARQLGVSEPTSQWTITIFLIGYTLGLLPYGPLSDRLFGNFDRYPRMPYRSSRREISFLPAALTWRS